MLLQPESPFQLESMRRLLAHELAALAPELAGVFGRQGLFLRCAQGGPAELSTPMLGRMVKLYVDARGGLDGDTRCVPTELPFADDSFRVVVLQHAFELVAAPDALRSEVARILEPGGIAMVVGFAPLGMWRPWLLWNSRSAGQVRCASAAAWRRGLAQAGVDAYAQRRIGPIVPLPDPEELQDGRWRRLTYPLRSSWLLLARKNGNANALRSRTIALADRGVRRQLTAGAQRASA